MKKNAILSISIFILLGISFSIISNKEIKKLSFDKPDESIAYENEITKDVRLGIVPRERLLIALQQLKTMQAKKTRGAISGITWQERGPNNIGGRTRTIMVDPNDATKKTVWAGSVGGGLWKTTDITASTPLWTNNNDFMDNLAISSMDYDPSNVQKMYCATGEGRGNGDAIRGLGVWISTNGGTTWNSITSTANNSDFYYCQKLVVTSVGTVLVATSTGIWRTTAPVTTASTFVKVSAGTDFYGDIEIASAGGTIYASSGKGTTTNGQFYTSANDGLTWTSSADFATKAGTVRRVDIACNGSSVYAVCQSGTGNGASSFLYSANSGVTWTVKTLPTDADPGVTPEFTRTQAWYDFALAVDPNNANKVWIGGIDMFKSTNNGGTWSQQSHWYAGFGFQYIHSDQHVAIFEPGNSSVLYIGNDGGIFRSGNASVSSPTFDEKNTGATGNKGYNVTQFYSCATANTTGSNYFLAGAQDNGSQQFSTVGMNSTIDVNGGDGCFCFVDQTNSNKQIVTYVYNNVSTSTDGGANFNSLSSDNTGSFVNPMDLANGSNILYSGRGANELLRWTNVFATPTKTILSIAINGDAVRHVKVSPNNANTVYVGTTGGGIYKIVNANVGSSPTITSLNSPWASGSVSCIEVWKSTSGLDDSIIATMTNYGVTNSVVMTANGTAATPTWTSLDNATLPDMPIRWAVFNPSNNDQLFIATELGVWSTDNINGASTAWAPTNTGLANVRVDMIKVRAADKRLVAATHGRGLFSSNIVTVLPIVWGDVSALAIDNKQIDIHWSTEMEKNCDHFDVEKSIDGIHFEKINSVKGAGDSEEKNEYAITDFVPVDGINYYRIKQVDVNGKSNYSIIVHAQIASSVLAANLYPMPAKDFVNVHLEGLEIGKLHYSIYQASGKMITQQTVNNNLKSLHFTIPTSSFAKGLYYVQFINGNQQMTRKIVIE